MRLRAPVAPPRRRAADVLWLEDLRGREGRRAGDVGRRGARGGRRGGRGEGACCGVTMRLQQRPAFSLYCGNPNAFFQHPQSARICTSADLYPRSADACLALWKSDFNHALPSWRAAGYAPVAMSRKLQAITSKMSCHVFVLMEAFINPVMGRRSLCSSIVVGSPGKFKHTSSTV